MMFADGLFHLWVTEFGSRSLLAAVYSPAKHRFFSGCGKADLPHDKALSVRTVPSSAAVTRFCANGILITNSNSNNVVLPISWIVFLVSSPDRYQTSNKEASRKNALIHSMRACEISVARNPAQNAARENNFCGVFSSGRQMSEKNPSSKEICPNGKGLTAPPGLELCNIKN